MTLVRRLVRHVGILATSTLLIAGCAPTAPPQPTSAPSAQPASSPTSAPAAAPATKMQVGPGGRWVGTEPNYSAEPRRGGLVKWAYGRSTEHLDPALIGTAPTVLAVGQVYSRIVRCAYPLEVARSGQPFSPTSCLVVGDLADSWDVSADGKTYTFHLHPGVKWQNTPPVNGREFSADDVLWNIKRYQTTGTQKQNFSLIKDASAPDKNTVVVNLDAAYPDLLAGVFAPSEALMLPHEIADQDGDFKQRAVGTGPFIMTEFQRDIKITYTRNPDYFRPGLPYLDALQIDFVPDLSTRRAAYKTGEYQFVQDNGSTWEDVQNISRSVPDTVVWEQDPISSPYYTVCRTDRPPFNDLRVRRALQMSYESQLFVDTVLRKKGAVLPALQWPVAFDAPPQLADLPEHWRYNPDRAKQLLLEAGLQQGIDVPYLYYSYGPVHDQWVQFIQNQMKDVGFRMNVQQVDYATYTDMYNNAKYEGCVLMVGFLSPTVDSMTYGLMHSKSPRNNARFNDPALDKLLEAQRAETDPIKRRDILKQIWDYEVNEAVRLPMPAQQSWTYWSGKLQGVGTNAVLTFPLYNASQWEVAWRTQ